MASGTEPSEAELSRYREQLVEAELASQTAFDRTLLALSGGALGFSLTFADRFVDKDAVHGSGLLYASWVLWALSLSIMLTSHYVSTLAMRRSVVALDAGKAPHETAGGAYDLAIKIMNPAGGVCFLVGVITIVIFAVKNGG
jgi:hypothetical protein